MSALSSLVIIGNCSQSSACRVLQEKALNQLFLLKKKKKNPVLKEPITHALYHNYPKLNSCPKYDQGSLGFSKDPSCGGESRRNIFVYDISPVVFLTNKSLPPVIEPGKAPWDVSAETS